MLINSQLEYMIIALLLKATALQALIVAYIIGTIGYSIALFVEDCEFIINIDFFHC